MKPEELITYCGLYGGYCSGWYENTIRVDLAKALAELVDASGCHHWMPTQIKDFSYTEFRKGLNFFQKDSRVICRRCCKGGDGNPDCEIRKCCEERGVDICFECSEFPCSKIEGNTKMIERAKEYKELGKDEWLRQHIEKAKGGYEQHTGKYYKLGLTNTRLIGQKLYDKLEDVIALQTLRSLWSLRPLGGLTNR